MASPDFLTLLITKEIAEVKTDELGFRMERNHWRFSIRSGVSFITEIEILTINIKKVATFILFAVQFGSEARSRRS